MPIWLQYFTVFFLSFSFSSLIYISTGDDDNQHGFFLPAIVACVYDYTFLNTVYIVEYTYILRRYILE